MDEDLLSNAREYARAHGTTFNQLVRDLVAKEVRPTRGNKMRALFELIDQMQPKSVDGPMTREEAHERG